MWFSTRLFTTMKRLLQQLDAFSGLLMRPKCLQRSPDPLAGEEGDWLLPYPKNPYPALGLRPRISAHWLADVCCCYCSHCSSLKCGVLLLCQTLMNALVPMSVTRRLRFASMSQEATAVDVYRASTVPLVAELATVTITWTVLAP